MSNERELAVIEVVSQRPHARAYERYTRAMIDGLVARAELAGWSVTRVCAEDLGTDRLLAATRDADAIVVCGGEDIDPRFYGGSEVYEGRGKHYPTADAAQIAVVQRAATVGTPLLGICRGHQIINVAFGGSLVEHIEHPGHRNEFLPIEYLLTEHPVSLAPDSGLAETLGGEYILGQSAHHQVIETPGEGLKVVGWAHDGLPEAVEHTSLPITGVQWHPEAPAAPVEQLDALLGGLAAQLSARSRELVAA
ncbi:gamma-glutamyl-gamma-aminobutyrate hydrolase family protein [Mycetocola tolaasinivorans]|uniref:Gamma-glutamyl-gamma-aminobutyrate hydrolase family protein n=1 Tax=Mycetocola tolaasinivorans TaxID=76635 RepID=A0A3L6ZZ69_9MICO|nr:gamma-glutamyl-gamma-aminobutyrate hydrolase family protein [Mycetocola tolaasinivorans]RLP73333.1 gamma-glutamyl-gamma-aminobutyrate hydrolase family protein [Mycetocola tolaasinivorans]